MQAKRTGKKMFLRLIVLSLASVFIFKRAVWGSVFSSRALQTKSKTWLKLVMSFIGCGSSLISGAFKTKRLCSQSSKREWIPVFSSGKA